MNVGSASIASQAALIHSLVTRGMARKMTKANSDALTMETQLRQAAETLRWLQANESAIRAAVGWPQ